MSENQHTFTKPERLCGVNRVDALFRDGSSFVCYPFRVIWKDASADEGFSVRFMVSVSKRKLKHATDRNKVKRQVRETYRLNKHLLMDNIPSGRCIHVAFIWIPSEMLLFEKVSQKMQTSLARLFNEWMRLNESKNEKNVG